MDGYERWWLAPSVPAPSMMPLPSTQMPQSAMDLVSIAARGLGRTPGASSRPVSRMTACPASSQDSTLAHRLPELLELPQPVNGFAAGLRGRRSCCPGQGVELDDLFLRLAAVGRKLD